MISPTAEYALRAVVAIAQTDGHSTTTSSITKTTKVPAGYLPKVLQMLGRAGLVDSRRGAGGGFKLTKPPNMLSVLEVVNAVDPIKRIKECPLGLETHGVNLCPLHMRLDKATEHVEHSFATTSISELLQQPGRSTPFCEGPSVPTVGVRLELANRSEEKIGPSQRRHEALIQFSRDHTLALAVAKHLMESAEKLAHDRRSAISELSSAWQTDLAEHFDEEERLLIPLIHDAGQVEKLRKEHEIVRAYVSMARMFADDDVDPSWTRAAGTMLRNHVRWEERELFPAIEQSASFDELQHVEKLTKSHDPI